MKACPKCQRANAGDAWICLCGYEFDGSEPALPPFPPPAPNAKSGRTARLLALFVLEVAFVFVYQNLFLFGVYWVRPGMPLESARYLLGNPYAVCNPKHHIRAAQRWSDFVVGERDALWTYRFNFCGLPVGGYNVRFEAGHVAHTVFGVADHVWVQDLVAVQAGSSRKLPAPSMP